MKLSRFTYTGPAGGAELRLSDGKLLEVRLIDGHPVSLPDGHEYTRSLQALGRLQVPPAPTRKKRSTAQ